jgi:hypothetical protein
LIRDSVRKARGRWTQLKAAGEASDELMRVGGNKDPTSQPLYSATLAIVLLVITAALVAAVVLLTRAQLF